MALQAFVEGTDTLVAPGSPVSSSSGKQGRLVMASKARGGGKSGKVIVAFGDSTTGSEYYDRVFGLEVRDA